MFAKYRILLWQAAQVFLNVFRDSSSSIIKVGGDKIIEKVSSQKLNFEKCFSAANKRITKNYNYLITTRGVESNAKDHFESNNWKVFGKSELILNLWPSETKKLGHPFQ